MPCGVIGALVVNEAAAHAEQPPLVVEGDLEVPILVALLDGGEEMLAPVLDPFDRAAQAQRRHRQHHLLRIHHELGAEAAADVGRDHPHLVLVAPQQRHQERAHFVGKLGRRPQGQAILVDVVSCERAAPFDRMRAAAVLLQADAGAMRRAGEGPRHVAVGLLELDQHVAGAAAMGDRCARRERRAAIGDRRQRLVIDLDAGGGILGDIA